MSFNIPKITNELHRAFAATVKDNNDTAQLAKFVKEAEQALQVTNYLDAGTVAKVFTDFYKRAGLDTAAAQNRFVAALAGSDNLSIRTSLAASLQAAIKAQVYDAPLPKNLSAVEVYRAGAAGGHPRAGRLSVLTGLGPNGKGADIFAIPAHIVMVPQQRTADPAQGGGPRGGVAAYGRAKVASATKKLPEDVRNQATAALDAFEPKLLAAKTPLPAGGGDLVLTGVDDPKVFAAGVFHNPLVPPDELQLNALTTNEARKESQPDRMRYGQDMLGAALERLASQAETSMGEPSIANPLVLVLPMLNTGPSALLTEAEAGWLYGRVARSFLDTHPGFEIIFAPYAGYRTSEFAANRDAFIGGLQAVDGPPPEVTLEDTHSPAQLLAMYADTAKATVASGGTTLNLGDTDVLSGEIAKLKKTLLASVKPGDVGDRYLGGSAVRKAGGPALSELFWQAHRIAELPAKAQSYTGGGSARDSDGLVVPNAASIAALLDSEELMYEVRQTLKAALGGDDETITAAHANLSDLLSMAVARTLQQSRFDYVNESQARLTNEVAGADEKVKDLLRSFGPEHRTLVDCMQDAQNRLTASIEQGKAIEEAIHEYEAEITRLGNDNSLLQTKNSELTGDVKQLKNELKAKINDLADAQRQLAASQAAARSAASSYSRATSSYSG